MEFIALIIFCKELHKPSHIAVFSLLLTHTIEGLLVFPSYAAERSGLVKSETVCDIFRFSYLTANYISCLTVLVISFDRFIGVQFPFRYQECVTMRRMFGVLIFVWVYVAILCLVPFVPSGRKDHCHYNPQKEWVVVMLVFNTLLPFLLIMIFNVVILKKTTSLFKRRQKQSIERRNSRLLAKTESSLSDCDAIMRMSNSKKLTKPLYLIIATYMICNGPSLCYYLLLTLCPYKCFPDGYYIRELDIYDHSLQKEMVGFIMKFLPLMEGVVSPIIYCWYNSGFVENRRMMGERIRTWFAATFHLGLGVGDKQLVSVQDDSDV